MRRAVHEYVVACIRRETPQLERYIAQHLEYPEPFPLVFADSVASIQEIRQVQVAPRFRADYPPVDVTIAMRVSITARTRRRDVDLGIRTVGIDVKIDAVGAVQGSGYDVAPQHARLVSWWGISDTGP